jgi:hypothetical protein
VRAIGADSHQAATGTDGRQAAGETSALACEIASLSYGPTLGSHRDPMLVIFSTRLSGILSTSRGSRAVVGPTFTESPLERASIEPAIKLINSKGVEISMDIEQLIYEAGRLQDAASLLSRLRQT